MHSRGLCTASPIGSPMGKVQHDQGCAFFICSKTNYALSCQLFSPCSFLGSAQTGSSRSWNSYGELELIRDALASFGCRVSLHVWPQ